MEVEENARVLVVDDQRANRIILERRLEDTGFEVTSASGGMEALDIVLDTGAGTEAETPISRFDAVVLDIMMPDVDGMEVLRRIRAVHCPNTLPVIMATAKDRSEDIVDALREGANDYVTKPIDLPVLLARLRMQVEFRRTHIALERAQRSLIEAAKMESLGRLAAGVAHEVKNPLYVLQMGVDYFGLTVDPEDETASKTLHNMQNAVDRANNIIRGMVDFSRSEELHLVDANINGVIDHALILVGHEIRENKIELELELGENLPHVPVDRTKIEQVLINLLANACQAMKSGGKLSVRTCSLDPKDTTVEGNRRPRRKVAAMRCPVLVEVTDAGPGIPEEFTLKLFDPFFTSKPAGKGTGLGLSVTKTIIDLHGGHIEIENIEPRGARARVYLDAGATPENTARFTLDPEAANGGDSIGEGI